MHRANLAKLMGDSGWRCLETDPPPKEQKMFFVGSSVGGRMDYVFRWPYMGRMHFWVRGLDNHMPLVDYTPDVWYPSPPDIPRSGPPQS